MGWTVHFNCADLCAPISHPWKSFISELGYPCSATLLEYPITAIPPFLSQTPHYSFGSLTRPLIQYSFARSFPPVTASGSSHSLLSVSFTFGIIFPSPRRSLRPQACTFLRPRFASLLLAFARICFAFPSIQGTVPIPLLCTYVSIGQYHLYNIAHHIKTYYVAMYKLPRASAIIHTRISPLSHCCLLATYDMCGCSYFG